MIRWHMLTGEYPPQPGGVSDYTRLVAAGLAKAGDEVHVWAPTCSGARMEDCGVTIHRLPGRFGLRALIRLQAALQAETRPCRLLVQYVPHMYGYKAMNLAFCVWLRFVCPLRPWVMFHEVAFPIGIHQRLRHNFVGLATRVMARIVAGRAERIFVSIPAWADLVRRWSRPSADVVWLPVPSNIPTAPQLAVVRDLANRLRGNGNVVIGHFGTYGRGITKLLGPIVTCLLQADGKRMALLIGRGSQRFAAELVARTPDLRPQVLAVGGLSADAVAAHLAVCDLLVQPYPDGVSSRRGSLMAGLALGRPIVTTYGRLSEPVWRTEPLVAAAADDDGDEFFDLAEQLLSDAEGRQELGRRGADGYSRYFSVDHTVRTLRGTKKPLDTADKLPPTSAEPPSVSLLPPTTDEVNS